jgi:hypothetical protein
MHNGPYMVVHAGYNTFLPPMNNTKETTSRSSSSDSVVGSCVVHSTNLKI